MSRSGQPAGDVVEAVGHVDELAPGTPHHALAGEVVEQGDEGVPAAADVVEDDGLAVVAERRRGTDGEQLVEGADAAGHDDEGVAHVHHQLLAVGQVLAGHVDVEEGRQPPHLLNAPRHDADQLSARVLAGPADGVHQSRVVTAEHDGMAVFCTKNAQFPCSLEVFGRDLIVGRTEYTDFHCRKVT